MTPNRPVVYGEHKPTPKILALLESPVACSKVAAAWEVIQLIGTAVMFDLPLFCKKAELDASATVLAVNKFLTTLEVFKDQAELDRRNANKKSAV